MRKRESHFIGDNIFFSHAVFISLFIQKRLLIHIFCFDESGWPWHDCDGIMKHYFLSLTSRVVPLDPLHVDRSQDLPRANGGYLAILSFRGILHNIRSFLLRKEFSWGQSPHILGCRLEHLISLLDSMRHHTRIVLPLQLLMTSC